MAKVEVTTPKVMFVLSHDHGSLAEAMYFLADQDFAGQAIISVPPRLSGVHTGDIGVTLTPYANCDDLIKTFDTQKPDILFLVTGYLLVLQEFLSADELKKLIEHAESSGCKVVTTDPMAGMMANSVIYGADGTPAIDPNKGYSDHILTVLGYLLEPYEHLRKLPHIYPWTCPQDGSGNHENIGYYNPRPPRDVNSIEPVKDCLGLTFTGPFWLFSMGPEDFTDQCREHGFEQLLTYSVENISWALKAGKPVVLVGPEEFVTPLQNLFSESPNFFSTTYIAFGDYSELNLSAEYVFYWNVLSASALIRIFHGLPTFHFSIGHIGISLYPAYEEVTRLVFKDCQPIILDQSKPFSDDQIQVLDTLARTNATKILTNLETIPSPENVIQNLAQDDRIPVWSFWDSDELPFLVQKCVSSWERHLDSKKYKIVLLSESTVHQYLSSDIFDGLPNSEQLQKANLSDFVRLSLLQKYGGIWLDATVYLKSDLSFLDEYNGFYAPRLPYIDTQVVQVWFISAAKNNEIINKWLASYKAKLIENKNINIRWHSLSMYSGLAARFLISVDKKFRTYFRVYVSYEELYRRDRHIRANTPKLDEYGVRAHFRKENFLKIVNGSLINKFIAALERVDSKMKWKKINKLRDRLSDKQMEIWTSPHLPSITLEKDGKVLLLKMNAMDRILLSEEYLRSL
jgi:hypothetical protein